MGLQVCASKNIEVSHGIGGNGLEGVQLIFWRDCNVCHLNVCIISKVDLKLLSLIRKVP